MKLKKNKLEWTVFAAGLVFITFVWIYLLYMGLTLGSAPPRIQVSLHQAEKSDASFLIEVEMENSGDTTAENVQVEVVLRNGEQVVEKAHFQVNYIPRRSRRSGYVHFRTDPSSVERMDAHVLGFEIP